MHMQLGADANPSINKCKCINAHMDKVRISHMISGSASLTRHSFQELSKASIIQPGGKLLPVRQVANGQWGGKKTAAKPASKTLYQLAASKPKGPAAAILQMIGSSSLE